tara:strand:- start:208 stop:330 length:123 start_codon:yes stop_codon:yes gene_type:complete
MAAIEDLCAVDYPIYAAKPTRPLELSKQVQQCLNQLLIVE